MQTGMTQISLHIFGYMTSTNTEKCRKRRADSDQSELMCRLFLNTVAHEI